MSERRSTEHRTTEQRTGVAARAAIDGAPVDRRTTTAIGVLFLSAFALYGVGSLLASAAGQAGGGSARGGTLGIGVVLILANSIAVLAIGLLFVPVLARRNPAAATAYLVARIVEAVLLSVGGAALWAAAAGRGDLLVSTAFVALNDAAYNLGMATLGAGSVVLCVTLLRAALLPRVVALWGGVGYALFALGSVLELLGLAGAGLVLAAPAGLFEVFLGVWLITVGLGRRGVGVPVEVAAATDR